MNYKLLRLLCVVVLVFPAVAGAVTEEDFMVKTTRNLLNLCTVSADAPQHQAAIHFCHGYLVGAYAYHQAANAGAERQSLVCLPTPPPSRNEAIRMFIAWAQDHPQYLDESPVETEFRFLTEKWPCKR